MNQETKDKLKAIPMVNVLFAIDLEVICNQWLSVLNVAKSAVMII